MCISNSYDQLSVIKKFVIHQLTNSKDVSLKYKIRLDFLHNYKEQKYAEMMHKRTGRSVIELYKEATTFISGIDKWIFDELIEMKNVRELK